MVEILNLHKYGLYKSFANIYHNYCYKSVLLQIPSFSALLLFSFSALLLFSFMHLQWTILYLIIVGVHLVYYEKIYSDLLLSQMVTLQVYSTSTFISNGYLDIFIWGGCTYGCYYSSGTFYDIFLVRNPGIISNLQNGQRYVFWNDSCCSTTILFHWLLPWIMSKYLLTHLLSLLHYHKDQLLCVQ